MGTVYAKKGRLYLGFKDENGKRQQRSSGFPLGQEKMARRMLEKIEHRIATGAKIGSENGAVTVEAYFKRWMSNRRALGIASVKDEESRMRIHVIPVLGAMTLHAVRPRHIRDFVRQLRLKDSARGEPLAPRSILHIYAAVRLMFHDATVDELIDATPCVLKRSDLPKKVDKDPTFRAKATFTRPEQSVTANDKVVSLQGSSSGGRDLALYACGTVLFLIFFVWHRLNLLKW